MPQKNRFWITAKIKQSCYVFSQKSHGSNVLFTHPIPVAKASRLYPYPLIELQVSAIHNEPKGSNVEGRGRAEVKKSIKEGAKHVGAEESTGSS